MIRNRTSLVCALGLALLAPTAWSYPAQVTDSVVVSGLQNPTAIAFTPDGRIFVAEFGGTIRVIQAGAILPTPLLTLSVQNHDEQGLIGMALDPAFPDSPYVYVEYTPFTGNQIFNQNRVSRFAVSGNLAVPGSEQVLYGNLPTGLGFHIAGGLRVTPDRYLFFGNGDNGFGGSECQNPAEQEGKLYRLRAHGAVPPSNPYVGVAGALPAVYQIGLRNPFRFAIQSSTGTPFICDVGSNAYDEINIGPAGSNFGWPSYEGNAPGGSGTVNALYVEPVDGNSCVAGCLFYSGAQFPAEYQGNFFFLNHSRGWLGRMVLSPTNQVLSVDPDWGVTNASGWGNGPVDLAQGTDGAMYYVTFGPGQLHRVSHAGTTGVPPASPGHIELSQSVPNPCRRGARIAFTLARGGRASVTLLDLQGRRVRTVLDGAMTAGPHSIEWDGLDDRGRMAAPGVYLYVLESGGEARSRRLAVIP